LPTRNNPRPPGGSAPDVMSLIDLILNLACLLLWLNWLALIFDPISRASAATLIGTLRKADPRGSRRWKFAAGLLAILIVRALIYWALEWVPTLQLGALSISFPVREDYCARMLLYSVLSFGLTLAVFYFGLLLLSAANSRVPDTEPLQKLVRLHLGWLDHLPRVVKLLFPFFISGILWLALHPLLAWLAIVPRTSGASQLFGQAALIGLLSYLGWKYLIVAILLLHLITSYVYFGNHPLWNFVNITAQHLLAPLRWLPLRLGRVDFSPVLGIALVFLVAQGAGYLTLPNTPLYRSTLHKFLPF